MSIGASIFLLAAGAICAFAVRSDLFWLDVQTFGGILMLTGAVMLALTLTIWNKRRQGGTITQQREMEAGQPTHVSERRIYHDSGAPPPE